MARNDRDKLIEKFLSRSRNTRTTKATGPRGYRPIPAGGENAVFSRARKPPRIMEDDPRWNASTMGNKTGYYKGTYYERGKKSRGARNYNKGNRPG